MKKILVIITVIAGAAGYSQSLNAQRFSNADKDLKPLTMDFSYYSKNYEKVFGEYNFTRDANNFGTRNVYVGYDNKFYYQNNSTFIMDMPNSIHSLNFSGH